MAQVADEDLRKYGAVLYDCETVRMIPNPHEAVREGIEYCGGWEDYENMGISVIAAYDFVSKSSTIYLQDNFEELNTLFTNRDIIIGFNNKRFDDKLTRAHGINVPSAKSYDIWKAITMTEPAGQRAGYSLNAMLAANGLEEKTGSGGDAPVLAQTSQWGKLISYCLGDVIKTVKILRLLCNETLKSPKRNTYIKAAKPWEIVEVKAGESLF